MKQEEPAVGVAKLHEYEDSVYYRVECECTDPNHAIYAWIEKDPDMNATTLSIYVDAETPFINLWGRVKIAAKVLFTGRVRYEAHTILREQAAINYANAIINSFERFNK